MDKNELNKELQMTYKELQLYLIQKYGGAVDDYFATPECKSRNKKITRAAEGLYCHHMDEDKGGNLGTALCAKLQPYEWQRKERLVYCNIMEHLILHIKIAVLRQKTFLYKPRDVKGFFTSGGIFMICAEINDMFMNDGTSFAWRKRCFEEIKENYEDYIVIIRSLLVYLDNIYYGYKERDSSVQEQEFISRSYNSKILNVIKSFFHSLIPFRRKKESHLLVESNKSTYESQIDIVTKSLASNHHGLYENIYNDIINCNKKDEIIIYSNFLKIDYTGYGYAKYASIKLTEEFGSRNADEYISKALPMYSDISISLEGKSPKFWKGSDIPSEAKKSFYIIRFETMFNIKKGIKPFVRYREKDLLRRYDLLNMTENHNLKDDGWTVLSTSDIYNKKKYYSQYIDSNGNTVNATVMLTLGREDYLLFKEEYNISYLRILNGCYFC